MDILPYSVKSKCLSLGKQTALMLSPPLDLKEENNILSFQQFPSAFHSIRRQCCSIVESKSETLFMSLGGTKSCCHSVMSNQPCSSRCCCFEIVAFPAVGVLLAFCWRLASPERARSRRWKAGNYIEFTPCISLIFLENVSKKT